MKQSWFAEHPWMTFFLASSVISGVVHIVRPTKPLPLRAGDTFAGGGFGRWR